MNVWFVRSNGETLHNNPATLDYVPGEPPVFPKRDFNYREKCLTDGFARYGWPNTGDLRNLGRKRLAVNAYTFESIPDEKYRRYLRGFLSILTGDLILIPADVRQYDVHLGVVVRRDLVTRKIISRSSGEKAYYYYHDIPNGQWYDCAHRVDVVWNRTTDGAFAVHHIEGIPWRFAFSKVSKGREVVLELAQSVGLLAGITKLIAGLANGEFLP